MYYTVFNTTTNFNEYHTSSFDYNIATTDEKAVYEIAMPSYSKGEVSIEVKTVKDYAVLMVDTKIDKESNEVSYFKKQKGKFQAIIGKTSDFDLENIKAVMENGVLTVTVSKKEEKLPKKYNITIE